MRTIAGCSACGYDLSLVPAVNSDGEEWPRRCPECGTLGDEPTGDGCLVPVDIQVAGALGRAIGALGYFALFQYLYGSYWRLDWNDPFPWSMLLWVGPWVLLCVAPWAIVCSSLWRTMSAMGLRVLLWGHLALVLVLMVAATWWRVFGGCCCGGCWFPW